MHPEEQAVILRDLESGGFGAELSARKVFFDEGFDCYAYYFFDKDGADGGKTREIDLFSYSKGAYRTVHDFHHAIVGEVKSGYTWILCDAWSPETFDESEGTFNGQIPDWFGKQIDAYSYPEIDPCDSDGVVSDILGAIRGSSLMAGHVSTSIHQHQNSERMSDAWYDAAMKVAKASSVQAQAQFVTEFFGVTVPLIVLDGNLLAAVSGNEGLRLEPREHAQVRFAMGSANYPHTDIFVHVVTMDGLAVFLRKIKDAEATASEQISRYAARCKAAGRLGRNE